MTSSLRLRVPLVALSAALLACAAVAIPSTANAQSLRTSRIATGLTRPLFVTHAPGDTSRIFIVEQGSGGSARIKIYKPATGTVNASPFLTVTNVNTNGDEQGLLGLAFHPDYPDTPYFFINFTRTDGSTVIRRYSVAPGNPDSADVGTSLQVMLQTQPQSNHNGGWIGFGPDDGYLYIALGDGGGAGDQGTGHDPLVGNGQSDATRLGKMLRIDVNTVPYSIPPDNPFVGQGSPKEEFWAKGLRNPWRNSFDRLTGDLMIADVGQNVWEEINFEPASDPGGRNYGWRKFEGYAIFNCPVPCDSSGMTRPIHVYSHGGGHCSVTGGYVYRGSAIPDMWGKYFYADYCSDQIWTLCIVNGASTEVTNRTADLAPGGGLVLDDITSFGEDAFGELYITDRDGEIWKILPDLPGGSDVTNPSAAVQTPNGGEVYIKGTLVPIQWDASDNFGVTAVDILYSEDGGATYPQTLATDLPNGCVYYWDTTGFASTTQARIKIVASDAAGNTVEDASNANFTIVSAAPQVTVLDPNGGESIAAGSSFLILWNASDDVLVTGVDIELSLDGGATYPTVLATGFANTGQYDWFVLDTPTNTARIRVRVADEDLQTAQDASNADFAIVNGDTHVPGAGVPASVFLSANAPEPFTELTRVTYGVPRATNATLQVYSTEGRAIRTLVTGRVDAGFFEQTWDGRDANGTRVAAGLYFLKLSSPEGDVTRRITLVR